MIVNLNNEEILFLSEIIFPQNRQMNLFYLLGVNLKCLKRDMERRETNANLLLAHARPDLIK